MESRRGFTLLLERERKTELGPFLDMEGRHMLVPILERVRRRGMGPALKLKSIRKFDPLLEREGGMSLAHSWTWRESVGLTLSFSERRRGFGPLVERKRRSDFGPFVERTVRCGLVPSRKKGVAWAWPALRAQT